MSENNLMCVNDLISPEIRDKVNLENIYVLLLHFSSASE